MHTNAKKVLIIDDDTLSSCAYKDILEMEGFQVHLQADARKALQYLHDSPPPDLILLDFRMPTMSGEEFVSELSDTNPQVLKRSHIVGFSSLKGTPFTKKLEEKLDGFVDKPSDLIEFVELVRGLTSEKAPLH